MDLATSFLENFYRTAAARFAVWLSRGGTVSPVIVKFAVLRSVLNADLLRMSEDLDHEDHGLPFHAVSSRHPFPFRGQQPMPSCCSYQGPSSFTAVFRVRAFPPQTGR